MKNRLKLFFILINLNIFAKNPLEPLTLTKFIDPLPIIPISQPKCFIKGIPVYELEMTQFKQKLHSELPSTTVWGFNGITPGPMILTFQTKPVFVKWINHLPTKHIFSPVTDFTPSDYVKGIPEVRTVTHLHGGLTPATFDGYPEDWITQGNSVLFFYPNSYRPFFTFYHDQAIGITALNVYAGLSGLYLIKSLCNKYFNLPSSKYDIALSIQDRSFFDDGSLDLTFCGNTAMVNGKIWPFLEVEPRKYLFRIVNSSNNRIYRFSLSNNQSFFQVGTDGGFLDKPVEINEFILAPAERIEVILDFSNHKDEIITLINDFPCDAVELTEIMQFRVKLPLSSPDSSIIPNNLVNIDPTAQKLEKQATRTRNLTLDGPLNAKSLFLLTLKPFDAPFTENPELQTVEIWNLINLTMNIHSIHLDLVDFKIINRIPFDVNKYKSDRDNGILGPIETYFTGPPIPPDDYEIGWKDTVRANPGVITRITMKWETFAGRYVWHCHILAHEDYDMIRPLEVVKSFQARLMNKYCPNFFT